MTSPVLEAEYAHDERNPLNLYDCLVPRLREYRRLKVQPEFQHIDLVNDIKTREHIREMELQLELVSQPRIEAERKHLYNKIVHLEHEAELIIWLEKIVHENFKLDAEDIMVRFHKIQEEFKQYRWRSTEEISSLKTEVETVKAERNEIL